MIKLRDYLLGKITLEDLRSRLTGDEPYDLRHGVPGWRRRDYNPDPAGRQGGGLERESVFAAVRIAGFGEWLDVRLRSISELNLTPCQRSARMRALADECRTVVTMSQHRLVTAPDPETASVPAPT